MKYICTLLAVRDLEKSKKFYSEVLGQSVVQDLGANVTLSGGFALQTLPSWEEFIEAEPGSVCFGGRDAELVFEVDNTDAFLTKLGGLQVGYVHRAKEHSWGQRVVRLFDPDRHVIEVGESMVVVVKRFSDGGLSPEETARRMDMPLDAVQYLLSQANARGESS